jgi:hypothetical protein
MTKKVTLETLLFRDGSFKFQRVCSIPPLISSGLPMREGAKIMLDGDKIFLVEPVQFPSSPSNAQ